jgi:hypothetical protein
MTQPQQPEPQDHIIARSKEILVLHDQVLVNSATPLFSRPVQCGPYRHFALYLRIKYTGTADTNVVQIIPQFLEPNSGVWHSHLEGIWASMYMEDTVHTTERSYIFTGDCLGREFRVQLLGGKASSTGNNPTTSRYYTVSVAVEFYN